MPNFQTYIENPNTGDITISLSSDSTCSSIGVYSQTNRAESMLEQNEVIRLYPNEENHWHDYEYCQLPKWLHSKWEYVSISHNEIIYRDHSSFKTYAMKCIEKKYENLASNSTENRFNETKFVAFSRTQCGEEQYHCVWAVKRSDNILEFQIGSKTIQHIDGNGRPTENICDDIYFDKTRWLTQGRVEHGGTRSACPIDGEFEGLIPDAEGLCAKLWSECDTPDIMFYQVYACDYDEVYEGKLADIDFAGFATNKSSNHFRFSFSEREYQCLGQWKENDVVYTFTMRRDVGVYECFVGALSSNQDIFIKEAGEHCQRDVDPHRYGMQLKQTKYCNTNRRKIAKMPSHKSIMQLIAAAAANGTNFGIPLSIPIEKHHINFNMSFDEAQLDDRNKSSVVYVDNNSSSAASSDGIHIVIHNETIQDSKSNEDEHYIVSTVNADENSINYDKTITTSTSKSTKKPFSSINESDFSGAMHSSAPCQFALALQAIIVCVLRFSALENI